ncbi:MAG: hypothetical protein JSS86_21450 [Cyanobacteria bacterium SZAS LIN-2]|nr:hypothetical protein [Cyanobacteria bacterium SZAS LIN-3]MBS1998912.1 hypothetical protein [Cyanobacteria bacterium SZAS LIN-2]MBS2007149.1 hypothetical protein [Cyanobacteria bacterium SZAS TMP-1]
MFPSDIGGILPNKPLQGTCAICGEPIDPLLGAVGLPLGKVNKCKECGQPICAKHFSQSRSKCVRCETGKDSWCKTPDMPKL